MKKAFTLIELMITLLLTSIFLNFVFRFYSNVLVEYYYLEAKDSLAVNSFRALQIVKDGVHIGSSDYIGGVVTLNTLSTTVDNNFTSNTGESVQINTSDGNLTIVGSNGSYKFNGIEIEKDEFSLRKIVDNLYLIEFNATKESISRFSNLNRTETTTYQRMVYTK